MAKQVTIKDIAIMSGVSAGTVDRILHNRGNVSEASRAAVEKVLMKTGYRYNIHTSAISLKKAYKIVIAIPTAIPGEYWGMIERGEQSISLVKLLQVCEVYHIPIEDLIDLNYSPQRDAEVKADIASLLEHCHGKQLEVIRKFIEDIALAL